MARLLFLLLDLSFRMLDLDFPMALVLGRSLSSPLDLVLDLVLGRSLSSPLDLVLDLVLDRSLSFPMALFLVRSGSMCRSDQRSHLYRIALLVRSHLYRIAFCLSFLLRSVKYYCCKLHVRFDISSKAEELDNAEELDKASSIPVKEKNGRAIETTKEAKGIVSSLTDGAQQHHQESEFGEDTLLFELIGNYIELRDRIRLRVVCRVWNEVVSQKEVYGMFVQTRNSIAFLSLKNYFSIFLNPPGFIHDKHLERGDVVLVSACQGILCFRTTSRYIISNHHGKYLALPAPMINHGKKKVVAILCHELGDGDFKLAIAFANNSLNLTFEVYAEGRWFTIESSIKGPQLLYLRRDGLYHNGSAYFLSEWGDIYKFDLATGVSFLLRRNALHSDILGVFQNRVCTFRFDRVAAGCELVVASVEENVVQCSLKLDWARLKLSPSRCRILACTKDHNIIIAIGMEIFWYKIHSGVLEPIGSLPEHDKANFVAYSCYDVNEILRF